VTRKLAGRRIDIGSQLAAIKFQLAGTSYTFTCIGFHTAPMRCSDLQAGGYEVGG